MSQIKNKPYTTAIILAGGSGKRMSSSITKQRMSLGGISVLKRSVLAFEKCEDITDIIVVVREDELEIFEEELKEITKVKKICIGGESRPESARRGILYIDTAAEYVAIHDAARPIISSADISRVLACAIEKGAAFAATPVYDTVKVVDSSGRVVSTPKRSDLVRATTPQIFEKGLYLKALNALDDTNDITDDNMMVERVGGDVYAVVLENENPKITTQNDIKILELLLSEVE